MESNRRRSDSARRNLHWDTSGRPLSRKIFVYLAVIEASSALPLAYFLPFSTTALVLTVGILTALNASQFATIGSRAWSLFLHSSNLVVCGLGLKLVLEPGGRAQWVSILVIGLLYSCLLALGLFRFSDRMLRGCFAAQQLALASTLIFWMVIQQSRPILDAEQIMSLSHIRMGLCFLFGGPLTLIAIVFFAGLAGWRGYFTALAGACAGQWAAGFFELGAALQSRPLGIAGFALLGIFLLLLVLAIVPGRHATIGNAC
jgi:hypothetical protein